MLRVVLRFIALAGLLATAIGCQGPLTRPMVYRLDEQEQAAVDESWNNILAKPANVDHTLLLDVLLASGLYEFGIDRLEFRSEKDLPSGLVVMEVSFDRSLPANDHFAVTFISADGQSRWTERYTREEVDERTAYYTGSHECTPEETQAEPALCEQWQREAVERQQRVERIEELLRPLYELHGRPEEPVPEQAAPPK